MKATTFNKLKNRKAKPTKRILGQEITINTTAPINNFKVEHEVSAEVLSVSNELVAPIKRNLPARGVLGQVLYDTATKAFYGWNGQNWISMSDGVERVSLPEETVIDPNIKTSIIQGAGGGGGAGTVDWGTHVGGMDQDFPEHFVFVNNLALNNSNDSLLSIGYDSYPLTIYNADGSSFTLTAPETGDWNGVFVRYDTNGIAAIMGGIYGENYKEMSGVALNENGQGVGVGIYVFSDISVYEGDNSFVLTLPLNYYIISTFITKYNADNTLAWASKIDNTPIGENPFEAFVYPLATAINASGNVLCAGFAFNSTLTVYDTGLLNSTIIDNTTNESCFIVKYNSNGIVDWGTKINGGFGGFGTMNDSEDIMVGAQSFFNDLYAFNADGTVGSVISINAYDSIAALFKYSSQGQVVWGAAIASDDDITITGVKTNAANETVVAGKYYNDSEIYIYDANYTIQLTLPATNTNNDNGYIIKYNTTGTPEWAGYMTTDGGDIDFITVDISNVGNIVVSGYYENTVYIYDAQGNLAHSLSSLNGNIFIASYSADGSVLWASKIQGVDDEYYPSVATNDLGTVMVSGAYDSSPVNAYNSDGSCGATIDNDGLSDVFIVKYNSTSLVTLANPQQDGQLKLIVSDGPEVFVSTASTIEGGEQQFKLQPFESKKMLWDAGENKWLVLECDAKIL